MFGWLKEDVKQVMEFTEIYFHRKILHNFSFHCKLWTTSNGCRLFCRLLKNTPERQCSHWSQSERGVREGNSSCKYFSNEDSYFCSKKRNNWLEAKTLREFSCPNLLFSIIIYINECRIFQRKNLPLQMEHPIQILLVGFFWVFLYHIYMFVYIQICTMRVMKCVDYKHVCNVSYRNLLMQGTSRACHQKNWQCIYWLLLENNSAQKHYRKVQLCLHVWESSRFCYKTIISLLINN